MVSFGLGGRSPGQRKTTGKIGGLQPRFSPKLSTRNFGERKKSPFFPMVFGVSSGEIWVQNPHFAYGFLWPGWFGAQIYWGSSSPPRPPKNLATLPLGIFRFLGGPKFPKSIERRRPPNPPRPPKVSIGKLGCFQPIFLRALPNSFIWPGWRGPKFPKFIGRPGQRKTIGKRGVFSPHCPQKLSTGNFGENGKNPPVFGPSSGENLGWKPPCSPWFPLAWVVWGPKLSNYSEDSPPPNRQKFGDRALRNFQGFSRDQHSPNRLGGGGHPSHPGWLGPKIPKLPGGQAKGKP